MLRNLTEIFTKSLASIFVRLKNLKQQEIISATFF